MSPVVYVLNPVPPLVAPNVPANVTAPVVPVLGVNPLSDVWNDVTPVAGAAAHDGTPPDNVSICPFVPAAKNVVAPLPD